MYYQSYLGTSETFSTVMLGEGSLLSVSMTTLLTRVYGVQLEPKTDSNIEMSMHMCLLVNWC